ncbi:MAG: sensor histidine kinase [Spirochaetia bacterium]|nr:sensor histidine kinase [Spirochaetia bacterium]
MLFIYLHFFLKVQFIEIFLVCILIATLLVLPFYHIIFLKQELISLKNLIRKYENPDDTKNKIALIGKISVAVVHDLKNPMSTIQTLVEMANTNEITKEERIRNLNLIHREISRLSDMAYEILDFVRGDLILKPETLILEEFIAEVYHFLEIDFEYANVDFILDLKYKGKVFFDPEKVRRVIINLAKNALEAMYDNKRKYTFTVNSQKINQKLYLSFEDNGPGLPDSVQERIFQTFATEGKVNGTGIGLYMAKWTMDTHKGEIQYKTERGKGTTFTLIFSLGEEV